MMIALGCDHGGYALMQEIIAWLEKYNYEYKNFGTYSEDSVDYPEYGKKVAHAVADGECEFGILVCGTGIGISIAANKVRGVRAALCTDCFCAQATREHNNANIIAFGARIVGIETAKAIVTAWLDAEYIGSGRHEKRVNMLKEIEESR